MVINDGYGRRGKLVGWVKRSEPTIYTTSEILKQVQDDTFHIEVFE
jgi:hypothetical protein